MRVRTHDHERRRVLTALLKVAGRTAQHRRQWIGGRARHRRQAVQGEGRTRREDERAVHATAVRQQIVEVNDAAVAQDHDLLPGGVLVLGAIATDERRDRGVGRQRLRRQQQPPLHGIDLLRIDGEQQRTQQLDEPLLGRVLVRRLGVRIEGTLVHHAAVQHSFGLHGLELLGLHVGERLQAAERTAATTAKERLLLPLLLLSLHLTALLCGRITATAAGGRSHRSGTALGTLAHGAESRGCNADATVAHRARLALPALADLAAEETNARRLRVRVSGGVGSDGSLRLGRCRRRGGYTDALVVLAGLGPLEQVVRRANHVNPEPRVLAHTNAAVQRLPTKDRAKVTELRHAVGQWLELVVAPQDLG